MWKTVLEVHGTGAAGDPFLLVLDQTVFFPTGGGQPCDLGTIDGIPLTDVFEKDGKIFHKLLPNPAAALPGPADNTGKPANAAWAAGPGPPEPGSTVSSTGTADLTICRGTAANTFYQVSFSANAAA